MEPKTNKSKIILALSILKDNPKTTKEKRYTCPDKSVLTGLQTNVAPVKYLLKKHPTIRHVVCLVTDSARTGNDEIPSALDYFTRQIKKVAPLVAIEVVNAPDNGILPPETMETVIHSLDPGDSVYLDTTGGTRSMSMGLMQLARILQFKGVKVCSAVYGNISKGQPSTIDDVTDLYTRLDLIGGMQELADFGSVKTLKKYYARDTSAEGRIMTDLLLAIENMTDAITLCRTKALKDATKAFEAAMKATDKITRPIMRELIAILKQKFATQITTPWLINWCLDHRMLTQALSLHQEWLPEYILRESGLVTSVPPLPSWWDSHYYQDVNVALWLRLMCLSANSDDKPLGHTADTLERLETLLPGSGYTVTDVERVRKIAYDYQYIRGMRNMVLHSNDRSSYSGDMLRALKNRFYNTDLDTMSVDDMIAEIRKTLKRFPTK